MSLDRLLSDAVERWRDRPFLVGSSRQMTYGAFCDSVHGLAASLQEWGVEHGDRVAVLLPNGPEILFLWFALGRLGAVMVPINPGLAPPEVVQALDRVAPSALVGPPEMLDLHGDRAGVRFLVSTLPTGSAGPVPRFALGNLFGRAYREPTGRTAAGQDPSVILMTSGTTERPKGVVLSHDSFLLPAREFVRWMEVTPEDRFLVCLPLYHLAGQAFAVSAIAGGASIVVVERFSSTRFWDQVRASRATVVRHLGEMLAVLCGRPAAPADRSHDLRAVYGGGARKAVAEEFERRFGAAVVEGYGLTETNTVLRNELRDRNLGSIGCTLSYSEVRIAGESGELLEDGRVGEIQVRRNAVMMTGYYGDEELTDAAFEDDWFKTGDLGYRDRDGFFYFVGRSKHIIRRRGENIVPGNIEAVLNQHPGVAESAVVGIPDRFGGEEIKAFLVPSKVGDLSPRKLVRWCRRSLADFEVPRFWELCTELPRTPTNKIQRRDLIAAGTMGGPTYDRVTDGESGERDGPSGSPAKAPEPAAELRPASGGGP